MLYQILRSVMAIEKRLHETEIKIDKMNNVLSLVLKNESQKDIVDDTMREIFEIFGKENYCWKELSIPNKLLNYKGDDDNWKKVADFLRHKYPFCAVSTENEILKKLKNKFYNARKVKLEMRFSTNYEEE
ncbi:hypothetical protein SNEBB_002927 [Seison nebaliae]|nr:hypothetical protein SNEBB_002927 [Seison nebaliae]